MKSLLHTLNDNDAILLMYLADELPAEDRAEVEAMLSIDAGLRAELEQLTAMYDQLGGGLAQSDAALRPNTVRSAQRRAMQAIEQWDMRRLLTIPPEPVKSNTLRWVVYSSGVAAAVMLAFVYFWVMRADPVSRIVPSSFPDQMADTERDITNSFANTQTTDDTTAVAIADTQAVDNSDLLRKSLDPSEDLLNDSLKHVDLNAAEVEINALARLSDPAAIDSGMDFQ